MTPHTEASLAYRIDTKHGALGYTGDTGPSEALGRFMHGVHTLIAECSAPRRDRDPLPPFAFKRGPDSGRAPRRLVLTHIYPQIDRARLPEQIAEFGWDGELLLANDGMCMSIPAAGTRG